MNVPACPIPIHQTKLTMGKAHATGMLVPHTPVPTATLYQTVTMRSSVPAAAIAKRSHHPRPAPHSGESTRTASAFPKSDASADSRDSRGSRASAGSLMVPSRASDSDCVRGRDT